MAGYDAFISYSHAADARLAPALQRALQRFAKPWWKRRALNLFRDETSLAAASSLTDALLKALETSRYFILLASPRAATSRWCNEEVALWLRTRSPDTLLVVLTEGTLDEALPPALAAALTSEPYWLDLTWVRHAEQLSERDPRFQQVVAKLAATLHGRSLEDISGEDVRQHRLTRAIAAAAVATIAVLAVGAGVAAFDATRSRDEAERQRTVAQNNEAEARRQRDEAERQRLAARKSEAEAKEQRDAAEKALARTLEAADTLVLEIAEGLKDFTGVPRPRLRSVLQKAEKILEALPKDGQSADVERRRMQMSVAFVDVMLSTGDTEQARRWAANAVEIARRLVARDAANAVWQRDLSVSLNKAGDIQMEQRDLPGALGAYEESRRIRDRLMQDNPKDVVALSDLLVVSNKIGVAHLARGDLAAAQRAHEAAKALAEQLAAGSPRNPRWRHELSLSLDRIGDVQFARDALADALRSFEAGRDIRERLLRDEPQSAVWQRNLSISWTKIGDVLLARRDVAAALKAHETSVAIIERLANSDPANVDWQRDLTIGLDRMGDVQLMRGDFADALRSFEASKTVRERLARGDPRNAARQRELSVSWQKIGRTHLITGEWDAAMRANREALAIREPLAASDPANAEWQRDLVTTYMAIADVASYQVGGLDMSHDAYVKALDLARKMQQDKRLLPRDHWVIGELEKRLAAVAARLAKGEPSVRW